MIDYVGIEINIEEMPQGCVISNKRKDIFDNPYQTITISNVKDAKAVISSLQSLIKHLSGE